MLAILIKLLKPLLAKMIYQEEKIRTIFWGPSRGSRYRIFKYGLSPLYGGWETDAQHLFCKYVKPGFAAYDIGANYGIHSLLLAKIVGPGGHVYSFEPVRQIFSGLVENIKLNKFSNVTCVNLAISDQSGIEEFFTAEHHGAGHLQSVGIKGGQKLTVETIMLDEFVFSKKNRPPSFIKIDVEGAESKVLSGGEKVLSLYKPILLVDLHNPREDVAVGRILLKFGYKAYRTNHMDFVKDLSIGWPNPDGLWGQFIAFSGENLIVYASHIFEHLSLVRFLQLFTLKQRSRFDS